VTISLGYPDVLFDAGGKIMSVGGARGQAKKTLVQGSGINREPVVTPDGKTLVFQRGQCCQPGYKFRPATAQIWAMTLGQPSSARPLTTPGFLDQRPAISPDGKTVAFIAENRGLDPDLCFARLDQTSAQPSCITDSSTLVDRPAWAPDGKSIVVVSRPASGTGTELLQYTSSVANSPNAAPAPAARRRPGALGRLLPRHQEAHARADRQLARGGVHPVAGAAERRPAREAATGGAHSRLRARLAA
jgi:hypothetical protein